MLRVPAWPLGAAVQNFIEKAAGSRVAPGLVGVGLAASGSAVGQEQGVAGTLLSSSGKGPAPGPLADRTEGSASSEPSPCCRWGAARSSLHALPSSGRKKGPQVVSLGRPPSRRPGPRCCSHAGLAGSTWAAGHAQPSAPSSPLRCGSPASVLGLLRFCDWSQALCQLLGPSSQASEAETVIGPISQTRL